MALEPENEGPETVDDEAAYYGDAPVGYTPAPATPSFLIDPALPLDSVQINSLVLLKIIKHCQDDADADGDATGVLLGMALENTVEAGRDAAGRPTVQRVVNLEVTNCFGLPKLSTDSADNGDRYTMSMMKLFREVNVDNNNVGFFQSGNLSTTAHEIDLVTGLYQHQKDLANNVVAIVYDPAQSRQGNLAMKAYRLSPEYMQVLERGRPSRDGLPQSAAAADFAARQKNILQEIPIKIKDLSLARALVWDLQAQNVGTCDRLELSVNQHLRGSVEVLAATVEDTKADLVELSKFGRTLDAKKKDKFKWLQERKHENSRLKKEGKRTLPEIDRSLSIFKPTIFKDATGSDGRLRAHLSAKRVGATCKQIDNFAGTTFDKLYLASSFHNKQ